MVVVVLSVGAAVVAPMDRNQTTRAVSSGRPARRTGGHILITANSRRRLDEGRGVMDVCLCRVS